MSIQGTGSFNTTQASIATSAAGTAAEQREKERQSVSGDEAERAVWPDLESQKTTDARPTTHLHPGPSSPQLRDQAAGFGGDFLFGGPASSSDRKRKNGSAAFGKEEEVVIDPVESDTEDDEPTEEDLRARQKQTYLAALKVSHKINARASERQGIQTRNPQNRTSQLSTTETGLSSDRGSWDYRGSHPTSR